MEINTQLIKPLVDRLYDDYQQLAGELPLRSNEEIQKLRIFLQKKIHQIETLNTAISSLSAEPQRPLYPNLQDQLRDLKLQLRFAQRRWQRERLNENRFRKNQRSNSLLASFAA